MSDYSVIELPLKEWMDSGWLNEVSEYRQQVYPSWRSWDDVVYNHYVIQGNDLYIELIGAGYEESTCPLDEITQLRLLC